MSLTMQIANEIEFRVQILIGNNNLPFRFHFEVKSLTRISFSLSAAIKETKLKLKLML